jgi:hypothetical protein
VRLRSAFLAAVAAAATGVPVALAARDASGPSRPVIYVLSTRADLVSGGEALISVLLPRGSTASSLRMSVGRRDVTRAFALRPNGRYEGLLTGLRIGRNVLRAKLPGHETARATLINHGSGGPLFAGPQLKPWRCLNGSKGPKCHEPTTYTYQYMSAITHTWESYNPKNPPASATIATTTTENGIKVPFVVRFETGYVDRDQYQIAVVYRPHKRWTAWAPQRQFVHKLLITHGASCGIDHESATAPSTTSDTAGVPGGPGAGSSPTTALGMGFAVMSTALDNAGHDCDLVTEAESLVMAKQHLIDHYGTLQFTIGTGCSGGSLAQQQIANAYPGIYQGILPQCSFPDAWSTGQQLADYHLTRGYFEHPNKWGQGIAWTPTQIAAVEGHPNHGNAIIFDTVYWNSLANPSNQCNGVSKKQLYNEKSNVRGVRCTLMDYMINVFAPRPRKDWSVWEKRAHRGFGGIPLDNVGVEYGLNALKDGTISPAQFVDVNAKIGGEDIDLHATRSRFSATEPALRNDYRSGAVNETNNLVNVAIIDLRGPDPGAFHDAYRSWTIRARLEAQEHHFPKNDVIWFGETPLIGDPNYTVEGLKAMDRWLTAVERDHRRISLEAKIAQDRPANVHDRCSDVPDLKKVNVPGVGPVCELPTAQTKFATPRIEAGESIATDIEKCYLEPLRQSSFYPITFTTAEWKALRRTFPHGVCDYTDRGVAQQNTIPWMTYQSDAAGHHVIYGGRPLGPAPKNSGEGWASPSFDAWLSK